VNVMAQRVQSRSKPPQTPRNEACADEKSFSDPSNQASPVQEATTDTSLVRSIWSGQVRSWYVHASIDDVRTQSGKDYTIRACRSPDCGAQKSTPNSKCIRTSREVVPLSDVSIRFMRR
jgi:hypothetical protein